MLILIFRFNKINDTLNEINIKLIKLDDIIDISNTGYSTLM